MTQVADAPRALRTGPRRAPTPAGDPAPARARHLRVVDPQARRHARRVRLAVWAFGAVSAVSVLVAVGFHVMLAQSEFELERLSKQTAAAQARYERTRLEVAQLSTPGRIVERATELGMVQPDGVSPVTPLPEPGTSADAASTTLGDGSGPDDVGRDDWGKVKEHLAAQP